MEGRFPSKRSVLGVQSTGQGAGRHRTCPQQTVFRYRSRISGPLLQRFDLQIDEPAAPFEQLSDTRRACRSAWRQIAQSPAWPAPPVPNRPS